MNSEQQYQDWKEHRGQIEVGEGFAGMVMKQINQYEQARRKPLLDINGFIEFISGRPLAKAGLIVAGGVIGFVRVAFIIHVFLFA